jgi:hypothetical protein
MFCEHEVRDNAQKQESVHNLLLEVAANNLLLAGQILGPARCS